jgi:hypothetical protein
MVRNGFSLKGFERTMHRHRCVMWVVGCGLWVVVWCVWCGVVCVVCNDLVQLSHYSISHSAVLMLGDFDLLPTPSPGHTTTMPNWPKCPCGFEAEAASNMLAGVGFDVGGVVVMALACLH